MPRPTSKHDLLEATLRERGKLDAVLATLTPEQMVEPGVVGAWSVKDVLAHLAEWERMALGWYRTGLRGEAPELPAPGCGWNGAPRLNRAIFEKHRDRPLGEVVAWFRSSREEMRGVIELLTDEQLFTPGVDAEEHVGYVLRLRHQQPRSVGADAHRALAPAHGGSRLTRPGRRASVPP